MKRILQILVITVLGCYIFTSCEKDNGIGSIEDLLGTYNVTVEDYVIWGADSGTIYDKGTITITKIDNNRVQLRGLISTKGTLDGGELYLDSTTNTDSYGYITRTYDRVLFGGGILTIFSNATGQLSTTPNGTRYPYSSSCYFEGRKMD